MTDPQAKTAERVAREAKAEVERARLERQQVGVGLLLLGTLLIAAGIYFLLVSPSASNYGGQSVVNLQRLTLGETAATAGAILFAAGAVLRYK
jgi:hypothetical protein